MRLRLAAVFCPGGKRITHRFSSGAGDVCSAPHRSLSFTPSITSGAVADYALDCTGGTAGMAVPINFHSFRNVSVLTPGVWTLTDGTHNIGGDRSGRQTKSISLVFRSASPEPDIFPS
jgi:hypothetical protein